MIEFKEHATKKRVAVGLTFMSPGDVFMIRVRYRDCRGATKSIFAWTRRKTAVEKKTGIRTYVEAKP